MNKALKQYMKVLVVSRLKEYATLFKDRKIPFVLADVTKAIEVF